MRETTFENARVGERLWHIRYGWGKVMRITEEGAISECFAIDLDRLDMPRQYFYPNGKENQSDLTPSWFWDEVKIVAPERPKRKVVRTVEGYANVYHGVEYLHSNEDSALRCRTDDCITTVKLTGEYEVEE